MRILNISLKEHSCHDALFYCDVESQFSAASLFDLGSFCLACEENKSQDETKELVQLMAGKERGPQMRAFAVFARNYTSRLTADTKKCVAKRKGEKMIEME